MPQKLKQILLVFALLAGPSFAYSAAAPVILSVKYSCGDPAIHIGSVMTVYMTALIPTNSVAASVTNPVNTTSLTLSGSGIGTLAAGTVYVTDGVRSWAVPFAGGVNTLTLNDGSLVSPSVPFIGADYTQLVNLTFRIYSGSLVTASGPSGAQLNVDLGGFDNLVLADDGAGSDINFDDGVWTGTYNVPDLGYAVANGKFFGQAIAGGQVASNAPFQSVESFSLDAIRPSIDSYAFKTNKDNYNGLMYISSLSQGTSNFNPTNAQGRFDLIVNKRNVVVDITLSSGLDPMVSKSLPSLVIPANATSQTGWKVWDGRDGAGNYVTDGNYLASLYIHDNNGVVGVTKTTVVRVVSVKLNIQSVSMTPAGLTTEPHFTNSIITNVQYDVLLSRDSGSITKSMNVLNWTGISNFNTYDSVYDTDGSTSTAGAFNNLADSVWSLPEVDFLDPTGQVSIAYPGQDGNLDFDHDDTFLRAFRHDPRYTIAQCWEPSDNAGPTVVNSPFQNIDLPDGNKTNDWGRLSLFLPVNATNPASMISSHGIIFTGATPPAGNYRLRLRAILTGVEDRVTDPSSAPDAPNFCLPSGSLIPSYWISRRRHFYPTARPEQATNANGFGIYTEDSSVVFSVNTVAPPTNDTTAPDVLTTDPQAGSLLAPGTYGPGKPLTVQLQDIETPINNNGNVTFIRVIDPKGGFVGGNSATNGGGTNNSVTVSFTPFSSVIVGGTYTLRIFACNQSGLCVQKDVLFEIQDQTAPSVVAAELVTDLSANQPLSINQPSPDGPFSNVREVYATLSIPPSSSNVIDWDSSTISLTNVNTGVDVPMTRVTPLGSIPSNGKLHYNLSSTLTIAGLFRVDVQTHSKDASGNAFTGPPASFISPTFQTVVNPNTLSIKYPNGSIEAVSGTQPIGVTVGATSFQCLSTNTTVILPNFAALAPNPGYLPITSTASASYGLQFNFAAVGGGPTVQAGTWGYPFASPLKFYLYFDNADLPPAVTISNLKLFGYKAGAWNQLVLNTDYTAALGNITNNAYTILVPNGASAQAVYGIFYAASGPALGGTATPAPTALPFKATRSFNPTGANALTRKAKFYYADVVAGQTPKELDVKIYDTGGSLIRSLSYGNGASLANVDTDPNYGSSSYFVAWDGANDTGNVVKNGIYLVRWKLTKSDGSVDVQTKIVALIK
jgi:flagellar hook assembly protein FlgD